MCLRSFSFGPENRSPRDYDKLLSHPAKEPLCPLGRIVKDFLLEEQVQRTVRLLSPREANPVSNLRWMEVAGVFFSKLANLIPINV
jgi:hypothetical protein